jgi:mono/diheme cytochrome c family protein
MRKFRVMIFAMSLLVFVLNPAAAFSQTFTNAGPAAGGASVTYARDVLPIVLGRCFSCHNDQVKFLPDWTDYRTAFAHRQEIKRRVWDSWQGRYYKEPMPAGNSPQCLAMTEAERQTIKDWVREGAVYGVPPAPKSAGSTSEKIAFGQRLFTVACMPCHQVDGRGVPGRFPPLAGSDFLNADKARAVRTLLAGREGEIVVNGRTFNGSMPKFPLTNEEIANVLTYVYSSFGNSGQEVNPDEVKTLRLQNDEPSTITRKSSVNQPSPFE